MKNIDKVIIALFFVIILTACSETPTNSSVTATASEQTALVHAKPVLAETQSPLPTNTFTPSSVPTFVLPIFTVTPALSNSSDFVAPSEAGLDYAMLIAPKVYNRLPYIGESTPYGEYNGCVNTNDFNNVVYYAIGHSLDTVISVFASYFQKEQWAFTEATTEMVGDETKVPQVSYDVYRVFSNGTPAFERLQIVLIDESVFHDKNYINVRLVLTHIETKTNIKYLQDFYCGLNDHWLWNGLNK